MLDQYNFKSIFKDDLINFIKYKRSLGLDYKYEIFYIKKIDAILYNLKLKRKIIDKEIWIKLIKNNNMSDAYYAHQYRITKDFCKFLISCEYKNIYYEEKKFHIINNYKPILFSDDEISIFFNTIDNYTKSKINNKYYKNYYSYSIIIRLIYACGLRKCEVLNLKYEDADLEKSIIKIIDSKRHISRLVVMSNSMKKCLEKYINIFNISDGLLFTNNLNKKISYEGFRQFYKLMLLKSNLNTNAHIHDLRHVFCNKAFNQMLEKGYDENVIIIYLYKYMGHKTIRETEYYLHFTDYNKQKIISNNNILSKYFYEGVEF